jgi:tubulin polyglutamylase TTLL6/13
MPLNPSFDLTWHDTHITVDFFSKLNPWQKVNMYPGIHCITKKHTLAKNLMRMYKYFPQEYDFFPRTFILPH